MTRKLTLVVPGDPDQLSGGYIYDRRLVATLKSRGVAAEILSVPAMLPEPTEDAVAATRRALDETTGALLADGLFWGAAPADLVEAIGSRTVALVHHPLHMERGLDTASIARLRENENRAIAAARGVLTTSLSTAEDVIERFGTPLEKVYVAEPGVDRPETRAALAGQPPRILAVGAVIPRKGYDLLIEALAGLRGFGWRLDVVGPVEVESSHAHALRDRIRALDLADRVRFHGPLRPDALAAAYQSADLFVSAAQHEGYGMAAAEALAAGLPLVIAGGGALRDLADGAVLTDWRADALREALAPLFASADRRRALADSLRPAADALPSWDDAADRATNALDALFATTPFWERAP